MSLRHVRLEKWQSCYVQVTDIYQEYSIDFEQKGMIQRNRGK